MADETLQFIVMAEGDLSEPQLLNAIIARFPDARRVKANSCDVRGNWLEIWENEDADPDLAVGEDGFLHYGWRIEVTPMNDEINEGDQVALARELTSCLWDAGMRTVVAANFEDQL